MSLSPAGFDVRKLEDRLRSEPFVARLIVLETVGSTNEYLRNLARQGAPEGTVVLAHRQTAGRGRRGQPWHSPFGLGLYLSVLFYPRDPANQLTRWTLAAAVAACETCRRTSGAEIEIQWPNDLMWQGKKLGGVLAEVRPATAGRVELVVGTGLNISHDLHDFPDELSCLATSLRLATGGAVPERERLVADYLRALAQASRDLQDGSWRAVAQRWERLAPGAFGQRVRVAPSPGHAPSCEGLTDGLDAVGALRILCEDGRVVSLHSAESVVPLEA